MAASERFLGRQEATVVHASTLDSGIVTFVDGAIKAEINDTGLINTLQILGKWRRMHQYSLDFKILSKTRARISSDV